MGRVGALAALLAVPSLLTIYAAFNAGGFFAGGPAAIALALSFVLLLRVLLEPSPFAGLTGLGAVAMAGIGGLAIAGLLSGSWSGSWARALIGFDRTLAYLLALVTFGTLARRPGAVAWMLRGFAAAALVVCAFALASRLLPNLVDSGHNPFRRLNYPVTYWNSLGLLGTLGALSCVHMTCDLREPRVVRLLAAGAVPLLLVTLFFTFSRAAIAAGVVAMVAYVLLARSPGLLTGLAAALPPSAVALAAAYGADRLSSASPTAPAAAPQAHHVVLVLGLAVAAGVLLRALLLAPDTRLEQVQIAKRARRVVGVALAALALVSAGLAFTVGDAPDRLKRQYNHFVEGNEVKVSGSARSRLASVGNNGRLANWQVALDRFRERPLIGGGSETYELLWAQRRLRDYDVVDGHSLYVELLSELGLVGLGLLVVGLGAILIGFARRMRGRERSLYAALLSMTLAWLLCAGVDWQWEMPVVTLWLFALGGAGLARGPREPAAEGSAPLRPLPRLLVSLGFLLLAVPPGLIFLSQRQLDSGVRALKAGNCPQAVESALASSRLLSVRPEPFELLAYCDVRLGRPKLAVQVIRAAVARDRSSWRLHYGEALVLGAARLDPRAEAARASRLNPLESLTRQARREFNTSDPRAWRRRALGADLPLD